MDTPSLATITTTDLNGWQYRAIGVLGDPIKAGIKAERYPLEWTITDSGSLRGTVDRYEPGQTDNDRRAIFDEWCRVLNAGEVRESKRFSGGTTLRAVFTQPTNRGDVRGSLVLDIDAPSDDEEG
ncbi:hypothetical protein [Streptomyces sp. NPDC012825]|uniref:hypothetical protein n=1 Tax=Streptomyces sp. NPDC012825 TaxID=3364851 RepID=UPI003695A394